MLPGAGGENGSSRGAIIGDGVAQIDWGDRSGGVKLTVLVDMMFGMTMVKFSAAFVGLPWTW